MEHITFVTIQDPDTTLRRVFTNRQQRHAHGRLNTSNAEICSPIVTNINVQLFVRLDKFSSCCAENEITFTRDRLPACDVLGPRWGMRRQPCTVRSRRGFNNLSQDRPGITFATMKLCSKMSRPDAQDLKNMKRLIRSVPRWEATGWVAV